MNRARKQDHAPDDPRDVAATSYWLQTADDDLTPRPGLDGSLRVDVAIVGAGYTGLWTARELLRRDPSLSVVVTEARTAGFGASGRNGGWLTAGLGVTPEELARRTSPSVVREVTRTMRDSIDRVVAACEEEGIDAQVRRGGILRVARGRHEAPRLHETARSRQRLGIDQGLEVLSATELAERLRVSDAHGAVFDPHGAAIHPGRLARGLARAVERRGGRILEGTPACTIRERSPRQRPAVVTARGQIEADAVVLACEAWTSGLAGHRREILPVYSLIVLTDPVGEDVWREIGWQGHELLSSHRYTVDYLTRTVDGRVLFGGRGAPYHYGSRIRDRFDRHDPTHRLLRDQLASWFPDLAGIGFSHAWGGPLGMPRDWLPSFRFDHRTGIGAAVGYTGQGVTTANLAGRVLADLVLDGSSPHGELPMVDHHPRRWEPEPLRWAAARYLQRALARVDAKAARTGRPPSGRTIGERLVRH